MKTKGHLCLIGGTSTSIPPQRSLTVADTQSENASRSDSKYSAQNRMRAAENELMAMKEVTDAAFLLMRSLPMDQLELSELIDLYDMFMSAVDVLELYATELQQISNASFSPHELKQLSRLRKLHWHLGEIVPDASDSLLELIRNAKANKSKVTRSKKFKKALD